MAKPNAKKPTKRTKPAKPAKKAKPTKRAKKANSAKRAKKAKPAKPARKANSAKPAETTKPMAATKAKPAKNANTVAAAAAKTAPKASAAMSPGERWWNIIERARKGAEDPDDMTSRLIEVLAQELSPDEIIQFDTFVNERMRDAFRWDLWAVAYIMNGGCSDDGFDYFCGWLVGKGKAHYEAALANPEGAAKGVSPDDEPFENEGMWYAASRAWEQVTGKTTDDFYAVAPRVTRTLQGEPFDEDTVDAKHPKLARRFGGG